MEVARTSRQLCVQQIFSTSDSTGSPAMSWSCGFLESRRNTQLDLFLFMSFHSQFGTSLSKAEILSRSRRTLWIQVATEFFREVTNICSNNLQPMSLLQTDRKVLRVVFRRRNRVLSAGREICASSCGALSRRGHFVRHLELLGS